MDESQARQFLQCLGAKQIDAKASGGWLKCSCPLARWTHQKGSDSNPSFGIRVKDGEKPFFNCYACQHGSLEELVQLLEMYVSQTPALLPLYNFKQAHEILDSQDVLLALPEFSEFAHHEVKPFQAWSEPWLQSFIGAEHVALATEYLTFPKSARNQFDQKCRGFPLETIQHFDVRYDHGRGMVAFPYRNAWGVLAGMRGRSIVEQKHFDYTWEGVNNARQIWFNETALELPGWVVVVEGQMDCMRTWMGYQKVVANLTAKPSVKKLDKLLSAEGTILIPDNDATGAASVAFYQEFHVKHKQRFKVLALPEAVKDADDCHHEYLRDQIHTLIEN